MSSKHSKPAPSPSASRSYRQWLDAHYDAAKDLPHPSEEFRKTELPDHVESHFPTMVKNGVLKKADSVDEMGHSRIWIWRTNPQAWDVLQSMDSPRAGSGVRLPCGHHGFRNLRGSPLFECKVCGDMFEREEIE